MDCEITDDEVTDLADHLSPHVYQKLGIKLGINLAKLEQVLQSKLRDYHQSFVSILRTWRDDQCDDPTSRRRLADILTNAGLRVRAEKLLKGRPKRGSASSAQAPAVMNIPVPHLGIDDNLLMEIANNLESDEQMESLARALKLTRVDINCCNTANRATGSVTTLGTNEMLDKWRSSISPENQLGSMKSAMTSASLLHLRDTVLRKAEEKQQQEWREYERLRRDLQQTTQPITTSSADTNPGVDAPFSSLHSYGSATKPVCQPTGSPQVHRGRPTESHPVQASEHIVNSPPSSGRDSTDMTDGPLVARWDRAAAATSSDFVQDMLHHLPPAPSYTFIKTDVLNINPSMPAVSSNPKIVPHGLRRLLSAKLNLESPIGNDWVKLAIKLDLDEFIDHLRGKVDPTNEVIELAEQQKEIEGIADLRKVLERMKRHDCVEIVDNYNREKCTETGGEAGDDDSDK